MHALNKLALSKVLVIIILLQDSSIQKDYLENDNDAFPISDDSGVRESHGTLCAGEIAMVKNNSVCGVGVAYNSLLTGDLYYTDLAHCSFKINFIHNYN